jgi:hypothetical protein
MVGNRTLRQQIVSTSPALDLEFGRAMSACTVQQLMLEACGGPRLRSAGLPPRSLQRCCATRGSPLPPKAVFGWLPNRAPELAGRRPLQIMSVPEV